MTQFPDIERMLGLDLGAHAERARRAAQQSAELSERLKDLVGRAETEDGRVGLGFSPDRGLTDVRIDARAMRMGSQELAETIERLSREAVEDLRRQRQEAAREVFGEDAETAATPVDPAKMQEALRDMNDVFSGVSREATAMLDQIRKRLGQ